MDDWPLPKRRVVGSGTAEPRITAFRVDQGALDFVTEIEGNESELEVNPIHSCMKRF